jgi:hypothetical protein
MMPVSRLGVCVHTAEGRICTDCIAACEVMTARPGIASSARLVGSARATPGLSAILDGESASRAPFRYYLDDSPCTRGYHPHEDERLRIALNEAPGTRS